MNTKKERVNTEMMFWQSLRMMLDSFPTSVWWSYKAEMVDWQSIEKSIRKFHSDDSSYGFYGMAICLGEINGYALSLLIEKQKEVIIGIQLTPQQGTKIFEPNDIVAELIVGFQNSNRQWLFDAIGLMAWRLPGIRFDFCDPYDRAVNDLHYFGEDSEAFIRFIEEINEVANELLSSIKTTKHTYYGALID